MGPRDVAGAVAPIRCSAAGRGRAVAARVVTVRGLVPALAGAAVVVRSAGWVAVAPLTGSVAAVAPVRVMAVCITVAVGVAAALGIRTVGITTVPRVTVQVRVVAPGAAATVVLGLRGSTAWVPRQVRIVAQGA